MLPPELMLMLSGKFYCFKKLCALKLSETLLFIENLWLLLELVLFHVRKADSWNYLISALSFSIKDEGLMFVLAFLFITAVGSFSTWKSVR